MDMTRYTNLTTALLLSAALLVLSSCDKEDVPVGIDALPDYSRVTSFSKAFEFQHRTVSADPDKVLRPGEKVYNQIFVSSNYGYTGSMPNLEMGAIHTEYLTQLYAPAGFKFTHEPVGGRIDSVFISLYYSGFTGDSIAPVEVRAMKLAKPIPFSKVSLADLDSYISDTELGRVSYYAGRGTHVVQSGQTIRRIVNIPVDRRIGQEIYDLSKANSPVFSSQESFDRYFPGIYFKVGAGTGSILRVERTALSMYYQVETTLKDQQGKDSLGLVTALQQLSHTSEVPQLSRFANEGLYELASKANGSDYSYLKSPAGVVTEIVVPTTQIKKVLGEAPEGYERLINSIPIALQGEAQGSGSYDLPVPSSLLLLPKDSVASFFEKSETELTKPYTTFLSQRSSVGSTSYIFGNIASVVNQHLETAPDRDLVLWVLPVERTTSSAGGGYNTQEMTTSITNMVLPTVLRLNFTEDKDHFNVIFTERKKGRPF